MKYLKTRTLRMLRVGFAVTVCAICGHENAEGELHWRPAKKEPMRVRLVALAWNHPRSSFFSSEEVFIAEKQLGQDESRLVKLVYGFLPYQPRLSEYGLDYSTVLEVRAQRDRDCDETLLQMTTGEFGDWHQTKPGLKYSTDAPALNLERRRSTLPCYVTSPEDYGKSLHEPADERDRY